MSIARPHKNCVLRLRLCGAVYGRQPAFSRHHSNVAFSLAVRNPAPIVADARAANSMRGDVRDTLTATLFGEPHMSDDDGMMVYDVELSDRETFHIGRIIALWGALEHEVFMQTLKTFDLEPDGLEKLPKKMNGIQFTDTLDLWKSRVIGAAKGKRREVLERQYEVICHYQKFRHALVHGMWDWSLSNPGRITSARINKRELHSVHFTADDLEEFNLALQRINFRIRYPRGTGEFGMKMAQQGFHMSRRAAAMLVGHPVADELLPPRP